MGEKKHTTATKKDANDKQNTRTTIYDNNNNNNTGENQDEAIGQGKLYEPEHAIKVIDNSNHPKEHEEERGSGDMMGVAADIKRQMGLMRDKVMEKLTAASVPSDALDNARLFLESVVRDVTVAAHGLTKDALTRIKTHLVDLLPSLSPSLTRKMVDDAEEEAKGECEKVEEGKEQDDNQQRTKAPYASPASSFFANLAKPLSRL